MGTPLAYTPRPTRSSLSDKGSGARNRRKAGTKNVKGELMDEVFSGYEGIDKNLANLVTEYSGVVGEFAVYVRGRSSWN